MKISTGILVSFLIHLVASVFFDIEYSNVTNVMFICTYAICGAIEDLKR